MLKPDQKRAWKVLSSRYLAREPWFTVRSECVELPGGNRIPDYYVLDYPDWVNVIALTAKREFVMVQQYRHGIGKVFFELCAGVMEKSDASPLEAAKRELLEETGYGNGRWCLFTDLSANPATHSNHTYTFLAEDVEQLSGQSLDQCEDLTFHLFPENEVFSMLQHGEIFQALMAAPLWKYFYGQGNFKSPEKTGKKNTDIP